MDSRRTLVRWAALFGAVLACLVVPAAAGAFPHVVQPKETLAGIAERYYGKLQFERVLATANALDSARGPALTPGQILEIPALSYVVARADDTWRSLAQQHLGSEERYITLAEGNGQKPWLGPELGQIVRLPYSLSWRASGEESLATLAYRYLGSTKHAYRLVTYNDLGKDGPRAGQILLIPLFDLPLTEAGERAALAAAARLHQHGDSERYERQKNSSAALREVGAAVRGGRYLAALEKGSRLLESGELARPVEAEVHRLLLETFVALGAAARAKASCQSYVDAAEEPLFDPLLVSPKILKACEGITKSSKETPGTPPKSSGPGVETMEDEP